MGYGYDELVAPAVLLVNPGINREQYCSLLSKTQAGKHSAGSVTSGHYHTGLHGLGYLLNIAQHEESYRKRTTRDAHNRPPPMLQARDEVNEQGLLVPTFSVFVIDEEKDTTESFSFDNVEALVERFPLFDPETMYAWPPFGYDHGEFRSTGRMPLKWQSVGRSFFIDVESVRTSLQRRNSQHGLYSFRDLALTIGAIEREFWQLLDYVGPRLHLETFFALYPEMKEEYDSIVKSPKTIPAKIQQYMDVSEQLRQQARSRYA